MAKEKGEFSESKFHEYLTELETIPAKVEKALESNPLIEIIADVYKDSTNCLVFRQGVQLSSSSWKGL